MSDDFNMSIRKFLKQLGVTSQQEIEAALREASGSGKSYQIKAVVTCEDLGLNHVVEATIQGQD